MKSSAIARDLLSVGGSIILLHLFILLSQRITERDLVRQMISAVPSVGLYVAVLATRSHKVAAPSPVRIGILWATPCIVFILVNIIGQPVVDFSALPVFVSAVTFCLVVGLGEELMFRGVLFEFMREWKMPICLLVSSAIFGLLHYQQGVGAIIGNSFIGLALGLARVGGVSLLILAALHALIALPYRLPHQTAAFYQFAVYAGVVYTACVTFLYLAIPQHWREQGAAGQPATRSESK